MTTRKRSKRVACVGRWLRRETSARAERWTNSTRGEAEIVV